MSFLSSIVRNVDLLRSAPNRQTEQHLREQVDQLRIEPIDHLKLVNTTATALDLVAYVGDDKWDVRIVSSFHGPQVRVRHPECGKNFKLARQIARGINVRLGLLP